MSYISGGQGESEGQKLGEVTQGIGLEQLPVNEEGVESISLLATDDAGDGTVEGDTNATDFTSQTGTTFAEIQSNQVVTVVHKAVAYSYVGPKDVTIGVGGSYVTVNADYVAQGTADHSLLTNLTSPDQHPQSAITDLVSDQAQQDQNLVDHETAPDPHTQYVLNDEGLATWVLAGYGSIGQDAGYSIGSLTGAWVTLEWDEALIAAPRGVTQDLVNNGLVLTAEGVWQFNIKVSLTFAESNTGRQIGLRIFNLTDGTASGKPFVFFVGRNQAGENLPIPVTFEVSSDAVGDIIQLQIAGLNGDTFSTVQNIGSTWSATHVSEALFLTT